MGGIRFSGPAKATIASASECAHALRHGYVGTEHMLLGLAETSHELLGGLAVVDELRERVYERVGRPRGAGTRRAGRALPYTNLAKRVLELAMVAARRRDVSVVEPEDLLDGMLEVEDGIAGEVLRAAGLVGARSRSAGTRPDVETIVGLLALDDAGGSPYYEQIVGRIKALVAEGRLVPGDRLPSVRRLADALDVAPGTVARAYGRLEEESVVETAGRNGTSIAFPTEPADGDARARGVELVGLLRPVVVAAFHLGATSEELYRALRKAVEGVFDESPGAEPGVP